MENQKFAKSQKWNEKLAESNLANNNNLPLLFDKTLALQMATYRKFRHVVFHGYGFQLEWNRMKEGLEHINDVFSEFKIKLSEYMMSLKEP